MGAGRPKGTKNAMRTPEEKEAIVLEALENGVSPTARRHGISQSLLKTWIRKYRESGIGGLRSRSGEGGGKLSGLQRKRNKTREEELELENLRLKIENARLKKGTE